MMLFARKSFRKVLYNIGTINFYFPIFQLSKKRVKLRQRYHRNQHLMTALCWECMFTEQIASRQTYWSLTQWWKSMSLMKSLDSMWRKKTGENGHYQTLLLCISFRSIIVVLHLSLHDPSCVSVLWKLYHNMIHYYYSYLCFSKIYVISFQSMPGDAVTHMNEHTIYRKHQLYGLRR